MLATTPTYSRTYQVTWEKLPADFVLPDDPVDNINQPALAAALTEKFRNEAQLIEPCGNARLHLHIMRVNGFDEGGLAANFVLTSVMFGQ